MRGAPLVLVLVLAAAAAAGCARPGGPAEPVAPQVERAPASPLAQAAIGMSADQVRAIAGEPGAVEQTQVDGSAVEVWYYRDGVVMLREGKVVFSRPVAAPRD